MWSLSCVDIYVSDRYKIVCNEKLNKTYQPTAAKMILLSETKRDFFSSPYHFEHLVFIQLRCSNFQNHFYRNALDSFSFLFCIGSKGHCYKNVLPNNGYQILRVRHQHIIIQTFKQNELEMKQLIYTVLFLLTVNVALAQTKITGTVQTNSKTAIANAAISVLNATQTTTTDKDGNFILSLPNGSYTLAVSFVGYATQTQTVQIENGKTSNINFNLTEQSKQLDEVVVTADKIETNIQKTPIAITALNAKKIEEYRIWSISDLTAVAPSTFIIEHGNSTSAAFINIRGAMGFTNEQAVATYVDGVYQFDFFSAPVNFNNIERIEILRGPQGTLYGRNAFSGVVNITTKKPTNKTSGFAELDFGNYGQQRYSLGFNIPIVKNKWFMGVGFQLNKRGSVYENPTLNTKNFDSRQAVSGNLNLKYLVSDKWTVEINARKENNKDNGAYPWVTTDSIARNQPYKAFGNWSNTERRSNTNAAISVKYFGNKFNFTSTTAGIGYHLWYPDRFDFDLTSDKFFSGKGDYQQKQLTQEFRFSSPASASKFKWTLGSFLFLEKTKNTSTTFYDEDYAMFDPNAPFSSITNGKRGNKGVAFYGQSTYSVTPKFDIIIGSRYDVEKRELTQNTASEKNAVIAQLTSDTTFNKTFNAFTPKIILSYKINNQSLLYASYTKGFRIGGFNINNIADRIYNHEKSDNYEMGTKNSLFNNKLKLNLTAFYFQQKDQQVTTSKNGIDYATLNVGDMNNFGVEAELTALPIKNVQVEWTTSTSQTKYVRLDLFDNAISSVKNYKGNKAIYNPAVQSMMAIQYGIPFAQSKQNLKAFVRGEYRYLGKYQLNFENTENQNGYSLMNARAGVASNHFDVALWVRNGNDVRYMAWGTYASYTVGSPRMWGVTFTAKL
jgi:iron complex outermembrane recepter protein